MSRPVSRRVFISYSHESREHVERVRRLYELLRANGVDARADFTAQELPQDWGLWTEEQVTAADRILVVTSAEYRRQASRAEAEPTGSGVRYEAKFLRDAMVRNQKAAIERFLLVLLPGISDDEVPRLFEGGQTRYRVDPLTGEGVDRLLRVLTGQPGYVEPDLGAAPTLTRDKPVSTVLLRLVVETRDGRHDPAAARALVAAACGASGATARDLGLNAAATRGDVPLVSDGTSPLGKWLRALHQEVDAARGAMRVRVGLAVHPDDENATGLVDDLAYGETARAMHATPDGELVLAVSEAFHALVADRTVRFPPASAYRSATANRADGPTCWVAVAGQAVCPDVPDETDAGRQGEGNQPSEALRRGGGDEYHTTVQRAKVVKIGHIGPRYEERR